jgi:hypothetical protein
MFQGASSPSEDAEADGHVSASGAYSAAPIYRDATTARDVPIETQGQTSLARSKLEERRSHRNRPMPHLEYFLVCESVSVDSESNNISLFNVLDDLYPDKLQYVLPKALGVSTWNLGPEDEGRDYQTILRVILPHDANASSDEVNSEAFPMNLVRTPHRSRAIQGVLNIPLLRTGDLVFEVLLNGERCASHTVTVHPPDE